MGLQVEAVFTLQAGVVRLS